MANEQILVIPETCVNFSLFEKGFWKGENKFFSSILSQAKFMDRTKAETDETHKQLIPYCVIKKGNEFFCYQRTKKGGEKRLYGQWAFGIGGHVNQVDNTLLNDAMITYYNGLRRELEEEVGIQDGYENELVGYIYNRHDSVGRVHLGILHVIDVDLLTEIETREDCLANGAFKNYGWMLNNKAKFEGWGQIILDNKILERI